MKEPLMFRPNGDSYWLVVATVRQEIERRISEGESLEAAMREAVAQLTVLTRFEQETAMSYLKRSVDPAQVKRLAL